MDHGLKLKAREIFLVDDDFCNITAALKFNHQVLFFKNNTTLACLHNELMKNFSFLSLNTQLTQTQSDSQLPINQNENDLMNNKSNFVDHSNTNNYNKAVSNTSLPSAAFQANASLYPAGLYKPLTLPFTNHSSRGTHSFK